MAGPAAGDDADPAGQRGIRPDDRAAVRADRAELVRMGQQDALEHLVDERARVVDQLLHGALTSHRILST